jgi:hypothetical protein
MKEGRNSGVPRSQQVFNLELAHEIDIHEQLDLPHYAVMHADARLTLTRRLTNEIAVIDRELKELSRERDCLVSELNALVKHLATLGENLVAVHEYSCSHGRVNLP